MEKKYRPAAECFHPDEQPRASHLLFEDFQDERADVSKLVFYVWLQENFPHLYAKAEDGNMGYKLKYVHKKR